MTEPVPVEVDEDGAAAARRAVSAGGRAVWVGAEDDPELVEFRAELSRSVA